MPQFLGKEFNEKAFAYSVERVSTHSHMAQMAVSRAVKRDATLMNVFKNQGGTAYARIAQFGQLGDEEALNYDGETNITTKNAKSLSKGVPVIGRSQGWLEADFTSDLIPGVDVIGNVTSQIADYFDIVKEKDILSVLAGIFSMNEGTKNLEFVDSHTYDISDAGSTDADKKVGATTLNSAANKACGAGRDKIAMAFLHSNVATNLQNLNLIEYLKFTDEQGISRDTRLYSWNGRLVIESDSLPAEKVVTTEAVKGVYTITIGTAATAGDKITIDGEVYECAESTSSANKQFAVGSSATTQATALKGMLSTQYANTFTVTSSSGVITLTQKVAGTGAVPVVSVTQADSTGAMVATAATTTAGVAEVSHMEYTSYLLGEGAFSLEELPVEHAYEVQRDAFEQGGVTKLAAKVRYALSPYGISYEKNSQSTWSPTPSELANGGNWALASSGESDESDRTYINHKSIPICRIISRG